MQERKPLIPPPPHFAINLAGRRAAADAQTADDVIYNHGPLVSGQNCCRSQHATATLCGEMSNGGGVIISISPRDSFVSLDPPSNLSEPMSPQPLLSRVFLSRRLNLCSQQVCVTLPLHPKFCLFCFGRSTDPRGNTMTPACLV